MFGYKHINQTAQIKGVILGLPMNNFQRISFLKPVLHPFENPGVFVQSRDQRSTGGKCRQMHVASVQVEFTFSVLLLPQEGINNKKIRESRSSCKVVIFLSSITSGCRQLLFLWSRGMGSDHLVTVIVAKFIWRVTFLTGPRLYITKMKKG